MVTVIFTAHGDAGSWEDSIFLPAEEVCDYLSGYTERGTKITNIRVVR